MPTLPWHQLIKSTNTPDATAMLTYLPLKHWWHTPLFLMYIIRIYLQLRRTPGLIGFSMRAKPFSKQYWTLSLWEPGQAMKNYIHTPPHFTVMKKMRGKMGDTAFVSWEAKDASQPLEWVEVLIKKTRSHN